MCGGGEERLRGIGGVEEEETEGVGEWVVAVGGFVERVVIGGGEGRL